MDAIGVGLGLFFVFGVIPLTWAVTFAVVRWTKRRWPPSF